MKQINGTVTLSFLEEDNQQRVIFRVLPLCTREGAVFRDRSVEFPDQGSLRIVPDKREQSTFKERMRSMGNLCVIQLLGEGKELAKVRQNRNYDPGQGEVNQFAIYSDVICEFAEDGVFEVLEEGADFSRAVTQWVLMRRGKVLYGPLNRENASEAAQLRPFGNDSYLLHSVPLPDGAEHAFYWNPEQTVSWRQRRGALRRSRVRPEDGEEIQDLESRDAGKPAENIATETMGGKTPRKAEKTTQAPESGASQPVAKTAITPRGTFPLPAAQAAKPANTPPSAPPAPQVKPAESVPKAALEAMQPPKEPSRLADTQTRIEDVRRAARAERRREAEATAEMPIGTRLTILDGSISFEEQIERLDQPLSTDANLLGRAAATLSTREDPSGARFSGTPLQRTAAASPQPIRRGEALHYVVDKQILTAHHERPHHEADFRHVENPIENLNVALAKAWESPETRQQAILSLSENEAFMQALLRHLHAQGRELNAVQAAQEQLQDIEAERLSLLMQLENARNDHKRAVDAMLAELTRKKRDELDQLDRDVQGLRQEYGNLWATVAALGEQAQQQTLEWLAQAPLQLCSCNGETLTLSPVVGVRRTPAELVNAVRVAMNRQGFACNEDDATELLLHFALNEEFCICGDTLPEAELCAHTMLEGLGLLGMAARTHGDTHLRIASLMPTNGLRAPTVEICTLERPSLNAYGHKTIRLMAAHSPMRAEPPLPVVFAPVLRQGTRSSRPVEAIQPVSLDSLAALREDAQPLWEQGEAWLCELDRQLHVQSPVLAGTATQQVRLFVSAASGRLRGGFLAAADAAVLGWVIPAISRRELDPEPLRHAIAGLPRCLSALGVQ